MGNGNCDRAPAKGSQVPPNGWRRGAPHRAGGAVSGRRIMVMVDPPIPNRFEGIARFAHERGWRLTLANRLVRAPRGWTGDGALVTLRHDPAAVRFAEDLMRRGIPVVDLTYHRPDIDVPRAIPDYTASGRLAAAHFAEHGLKRVAWFSTEWSNVQRLFYEGLAGCATAKESLQDGMALARPSCRNPGAGLRIVLSEFMPRSRLDDPDRFAAALGPRLQALPKPAGILAYNDEEAARLAALCLDIGIQVPEEIAILGIGNDAFLCENQPVPISSVDDELGRAAYEAAALLERLMDGEPPPASPVLVPCTRIVARRSTDTLATESPVLRKALELLFADLRRVPSIPQIATAIGVSRATLDRLFLRELGHPAHAELLRGRLAEARRLLIETDLPVAEISVACGFCNPGYFAVAFARAEGATPAKWRRGYRRN